MITACLELKNTYMERFLKKQDIFDFSPQDEYDILFCDDLTIHDHEVEAKNNVYLACHKLEYLNDTERYCDFEYFIGFGNELYEGILSKFDFKASKVFDGFIYDEEYENSFEDKKYDLFFVSTLPNHNLFESFMMIDWLSIVDILQEVTEKKLTIGTNLNKIDNDYLKKTLKDKSRGKNDDNDLIQVYEKFENEIEYVNFDFPLKFLNNSKSIYFLDSLDSRIYYGNIYSKAIVSSFKTSMLYGLQQKKEYLKEKHLKEEYLWPKHTTHNIVIANSLKNHDPSLYDLCMKIDEILFENYVKRAYSLTKSYFNPEIKKFMKYINDDNNDEQKLKFNVINCEFIEILNKIV